MLNQEQREANKKAQDLIDSQIDTIKKVLPPFPSTTNIFARQPNKLYSKEKVKSMIWEAIERASKHDLWFEFEAYLNDHWLNGNLGENEDKTEAFEDDLINSFID